MIIRLLLAVVLCVSLGGFLMAEEEAAPAAEGQVETADDDTGTRNVTGIVIQVVIFILFLGVVYYIFIHPEKPVGDKTSDPEDSKPTVAEEPAADAAGSEDDDEKAGEKKEDEPPAEADEKKEEDSQGGQEEPKDEKGEGKDS